MNLANSIEKYTKLYNPKWEVNQYDDCDRSYNGQTLNKCIEVYHNDPDQFDGMCEIWYNSNDQLTQSQIDDIAEQSADIIQQALDDHQDVMINVVFENEQPTLVPEYI